MLAECTNVVKWSTSYSKNKGGLFRREQTCRKKREGRKACVLVGKQQLIALSRRGWLSGWLLLGLAHSEAKQIHSPESSILECSLFGHWKDHLLSVGLDDPLALSIRSSLMTFSFNIRIQLSILRAGDFHQPKTAFKKATMHKINLNM